MDRVDPPPRKRQRGRPAGTSASRDAILDAAKKLFGTHGYDGASMRAIAADAGVDPALIRHFFADKEGLFAAVLSSRTVIPGLLIDALDGDPDTVGTRLTATYLKIWDDEELGPLVKATVRTAFASERFAGLFSEIISTRIAPHWMPSADDADTGADEVALRLALAGAHLLGVASARHLTAGMPLATIDRDRLVAIIGPTIQHYLTGPLSRP